MLFWESGSAVGLISDKILLRPSAVIATGVAKTLSGELFRHLGVSALWAFAGLAVGGSIGFALGVLNGMSRQSAIVTDTSLQMIRNISNLALLPLVIVLFGIGEGAKLFLVSLSVFFPIYLNTFHGIRNVDAQLIEMGKAYGMSRQTLFRRIMLPGALSSVFVSLSSALGVMWLTLIVADTLSASSGLGHTAMQGREYMLIDTVVLAILLYALLGKFADSFTRYLEKRTLASSPTYARR